MATLNSHEINNIIDMIFFSKVINLEEWQLQLVRKKGSGKEKILFDINPQIADRYSNRQSKLKQLEMYSENLEIKPFLCKFPKKPFKNEKPKEKLSISSEKNESQLSVSKTEKKETNKKNFVQEKHLFEYCVTPKKTITYKQSSQDLESRYQSYFNSKKHPKKVIEHLDKQTSLQKINRVEINKEENNVLKDKEFCDKQVDVKLKHKGDHSKPRKRKFKKLQAKSASNFIIGKDKDCKKNPECPCATLSKKKSLDILFKKSGNFEKSEQNSVNNLVNKNKTHQYCQYENKIINIKDLFSFQDLNLKNKSYNNDDLKSITSSNTNYPNIYSSETDIDFIIKRNLTNLWKKCSSTTSNPETTQEQHTVLKLSPYIYEFREKESEKILSSIDTDDLEIYPVKNYYVKNVTSSSQSKQKIKKPPSLPPVDFDIELQL